MSCCVPPVSRVPVYLSVVSGDVCPARPFSACVCCALSVLCGAYVCPVSSVVVAFEAFIRHMAPAAHRCECERGRVTKFRTLWSPKTAHRSFSPAPPPLLSLAFFPSCTDELDPPGQTALFFLHPPVTQPTIHRMEGPFCFCHSAQPDFSVCFCRLLCLCPAPPRPVVLSECNSVDHSPTS